MARPQRRVQAAALVVLALLALVPLHGVAQEPRRLHRVGVLDGTIAPSHPVADGLKAGLRELGFEEGRNVAFEVRAADGTPESLAGAATALVASGIELVVTCHQAATQAAMAATRKIPIVFTLVGDPVASGIVKTLAHPDGNVTGISSLTTELVPKRLEILKALVPRIRRVWAIYHGADAPSTAAIVKALEVMPRLGLELTPRTVVSPAQLEAVLKEARPGDALLAPDLTTMNIPAVLLEASLASRIPAVFSAERWVTHGGLVSYGADYRAQGVQAARLVARILRGMRPQELPVEGAERITLALNVTTAARLDLTVPRRLLLRADVIQR
jgi:putative ABC transport system substrate-binding protein